MAQPEAREYEDAIAALTYHVLPVKVMAKDVVKLTESKTVSKVE